MVTGSRLPAARARWPWQGRGQRVLCASLAAFLGGALLASHARADSGSPGRLEVLGLSLLLPGLGHRALGYTDRATAFMAADGVIWAGFVTLQVQGSLRKDGYVELAEIDAGVEKAEGRSDEYYRLLGSYSSSELYDDEIRRDARAQYPDDLQARSDYFDSNRIPDDRRWEWESSAAWERYRDKRGDSLESYKRADYMLMLAVANRLLAAVDALRLAHNQGQEPALGLYLEAEPFDSRAPAYLGVKLRLP